MCAREDIDFQGKEMKSNFDEVESKLDAKLDCVQQKLDAVLKMLGKKELNEWLKNAFKRRCSEVKDYKKSRGKKHLGFLEAFYIHRGRWMNVRSTLGV